MKVDGLILDFWEVIEKGVVKMVLGSIFGFNEFFYYNVKIFRYIFLVKIIDSFRKYIFMRGNDKIFKEYWFY